MERIENIASNIKTVKRRLELPMPVKDETVQLVCYGPSLKYSWKSLRIGELIVSVSGAHMFLTDKGIQPNIHVEFDWREHKAQHIKEPGATAFHLASCVHPKLVDKVDNIFLWHAQQTAQENSFIHKYEPGAYLVPGGSSVGLRAIELLIALGFRKFDIHGMDSSFEDTEWAGPHFGKSKEKREIIDVIACGRKFRTSIAFLMYADQFRACKRAHPDVTLNLYGDGLLQAVNKMEMAA